ncbi:MAG TPA: hydrogenase maturation nickel metallochaperone HypA [Phycisphaerae bacterium]|nr:hydrogenase maturation nickel metallochaperone HypA [Phycisphaerae bacterium]
MHELSIAEALVEQIRRYAPSGAILAKARVEIGPRRAVDDDALRFAWQALVANTDFEGAKLEIILHPWDLFCNKCKRHWTSMDPLERCSACGSEETQAGGSNDLRLLSIEVAPDFLPLPQRL